jgi:soluble lytic murein transglycosylase-like protein
MTQVRSKRLLFSLLTAAVVVALPSQARAEVIVFTSGRTMSVKAYRLSGERITVTLRQGGEAVFDRALIGRIDPDEVPDLVEPVAQPVQPGAGESLKSRPFAALIESVSLRHGIDPALVHAVVAAESNYRAAARSQVGARGLMQVMPATARDLGLSSTRALFDPAENLETGVKYLKSLLVRFDGDLPIALAAYNAGPGAVSKYDGIPPYPETQNYVRKVLSSFQP